MIDVDLQRILIDEEISLMKINSNYKNSILILRSQPDSEDFQSGIDDLYREIAYNAHRLGAIGLELRIMLEAHRRAQIVRTS